MNFIINNPQMYVLLFLCFSGKPEAQAAKGWQREHAPSFLWFSSKPQLLFQCHEPVLLIRCPGQIPHRSGGGNRGQAWTTQTWEAKQESKTHQQHLEDLWLCPSETRKLRRSWWAFWGWTTECKVLTSQLSWWKIPNELINKFLGWEDWLGARHWLCKWHRLSHLFCPTSLWDQYHRLCCRIWKLRPRDVPGVAKVHTWSMADLRLEHRPVRCPICHYLPSALFGFGRSIWRNLNIFLWEPSQLVGPDFVRQY